MEFGLSMHESLKSISDREYYRMSTSSNESQSIYSDVDPVGSELHKKVSAVGDLTTKLISSGVSRLMVKKKKGLFGKYRTRRARNKYSKTLSNRLSTPINTLTNIGTTYAYNKYLKD